MPGVDLQMINEARWHTSDSPVYRSSMALAKQLYDARLESMRSLPRQLADAIRSLRVVAIADGQTDLVYDGTPPFVSPQRRVERVRSPPVRQPPQNLDEYANQNFWCVEPVMALEWWRIVRDGDEVVQLDALTTDQGKRVQRFFEDSDLETLDHTVDGELLAVALHLSY